MVGHAKYDSLLETHYSDHVYVYGRPTSLVLKVSASLVAAQSESPLLALTSLTASCRSSLVTKQSSIDSLLVPSTDEVENPLTERSKA